MKTARPQLTRLRLGRRTGPYWVSTLVLVATILSIAACSGTTPVAPEPDTPVEPASPTAEESATPAQSESVEFEPAPDFELVLFANDEHEAGEAIKLSDFMGRPVVINFWFPSCPPCVAEMPEFEEAYQQFKEDGVQFIGVQLLGLDTVEDGQTFVNRLKVNYALGPDDSGDSFGDILRNYSVSSFPTTVFIDRNQNINRTWAGPLNLEKLEELIQEIL